MTTSIKIQQLAYNRTPYVNNSLRIQGTKLWHQLSYDTKEATNVPRFRNILKHEFGPSYCLTMPVLCKIRNWLKFYLVRQHKITLFVLQ